MVVPLARLAVLVKGLSLTLRGYRDFLENYPVDVIVFRALKGKEAVYPFDLLASYGAGIYERGCPRFRTLDAAVLMPSAFTPGRLFLSLPVVVGSTNTASKTTLAITRGAARAEGYNIVANRRQALRRGDM